MSARRIDVVAQYDEHYFLLRRRVPDAVEPRRIGNPIRWRDAAAERLCMLTREMHNRTIIEASFASAGVSPRPAMETNSVLPLVLAVLAGDVCSVLPGALVDIALQYPELEALPLVEPDVVTPIGLLIQRGGLFSITQHAALRMASEPDWLAHAARHSGLLDG